jgi:hypothetical protein
LKVVENERFWRTVKWLKISGGGLDRLKREKGEVWLEGLAGGISLGKM